MFYFIVSFAHADTGLFDKTGKDKPQQNALEEYTPPHMFNKNMIRREPTSPMPADKNVIILDADPATRKTYSAPALNRRAADYPIPRRRPSTLSVPADLINAIRRQHNMRPLDESYEPAYVPYIPDFKDNNVRYDIKELNAQNILNEIE